MVFFFFRHDAKKRTNRQSIEDQNIEGIIDFLLSSDKKLVILFSFVICLWLETKIENQKKILTHRWPKLIREHQIEILVV